MVIFKWFGDKVKAELERRARALRDEALEFMLQRYIAYAPFDTGYMVSTAKIVQSDTSGKFGGYVTVTAPYAAWVEFGHWSVRGAGGKFIPITTANFDQAEWFPPQPAMRMAIDDTKAEFPKLAAKIAMRGGVGGSNTVSAGISK